MKNELRELPEPWPQIQWIGTNRNGDFMGTHTTLRQTYKITVDLHIYIYIHNMYIHISEDG